MLLHHPNDPPPLHAPPAQCRRLRAASTHPSALRLSGGPVSQLRAMVANVISAGQLQICNAAELTVNAALMNARREVSFGVDQADAACITTAINAVIHRSELNGAAP